MQTQCACSIVHRMLAPLLALLVLVVGQACSQGPWAWIDPQPEHVVEVYAWQPGAQYPGSQFAGDVPYTLLISIWVMNTGTPQIGGDPFSKVEVDFGDGSGWLDLTRDAMEKWWAPPEDTYTDHMTPHQYTAPGEYDIRARVTFSDDGATVEDLAPHVHVSVLPAGTSS